MASKLFEGIARSVDGPPKPREVRVNDRRRVTLNADNEPAPGDHAERVYNAILKATCAYFSTITVGGEDVRMPPEKLEDMARHATANVMAIGVDDREWIAVPTQLLEVGDVFVRYDIVAGQPIDEEVTVVRPVIGGAKYDERIVTIGTAKGNRQIAAHVDHVFRVHRPKVDREALRDLLSEEL